MIFLLRVVGPTTYGRLNHVELPHLSKHQSSLGFSGKITYLAILEVEFRANILPIILSADCNVPIITYA